MNRRDDIEVELKEISTVVAGLPAQHPYKVPEGYFAQLPEEIIAIVAPTPSLLDSLPKNTSFEVPAGYFESLADNILGKIRMQEVEREELQQLSPYLASLSKTLPFSIPDNYFETLPAHLLATINQPIASDQSQPTETAAQSIQQARVIAIPRSLRTFLAAAVTVGVIIMSALWGNELYNDANPLKTGLKIRTDEQFNVALSNVSDQEIVDYLKQHADGSDIESIASQVNSEDLPEVEDYFNNHSTSVDEWLNNNGETKFTL